MFKTESGRMESGSFKMLGMEMEKDIDKCKKVNLLRK